MTSVERQKSLQWLGELNLITDDSSPLSAFAKTSVLAEKHGLSVYDATYLEAAMRRGCSLATRDNALRKAAEVEGVPIV